MEKIEKILIIAIVLLAIAMSILVLQKEGYIFQTAAWQGSVIPNPSDGATGVSTNPTLIVTVDGAIEHDYVDVCFYGKKKGEYWSLFDEVHLFNYIEDGNHGIATTNKWKNIQESAQYEWAVEIYDQDWETGVGYGIWSNAGDPWKFTTTGGYINQPPVADANGPYEGKVNKSILLDGSSSYDPDGTIEQYYWSYTTVGKSHYPISIGHGKTIYYSWGAPNTYQVTLRVTDDDGATDTNNAIVEITEEPVSPPPSEVSDAILITSVCLFSFGVIIAALIYKRKSK